MGRLDGKVAIVTGGGSGIGAATARRLVDDGAAVVVADIDEGRLVNVVDHLTPNNGRASAHVLDVSEEPMVVGLVQEAVARYGRLDILINNAAAVGPSVHGRDGAIAQGEVAVWDRTYTVNLRGVMLGCKHAIPRMLEKGGGVIVNLSSSAAAAVGPGAVAYSATKGGVVSVTKHVAARYGRLGIRSVAIAPGLVLPDEMDELMDQEWRTAFLRQQVTNHLGRPRDVANLISFLVSDEAAFITGSVIDIDGGSGCHRGSLADEMELLGEPVAPL